MSREEAIELIKGINTTIEVIEIVNKIFDDIEFVEICKNCQYYDGKYCMKDLHNLVTRNENFYCKDFKKDK